MITYKYYKFPNKETVPSSEQWPQNVTVNEIGIIYNNDGKFNELGELIKPPTPKNGWHVNICYQGDINLEFIKQYEIKINSPICKWFGQIE